MENKKTFGEYLRLKRTECGLTQKEFAEKLYVTESAVSKWERGLSYPDITLINDMCALLQISEHELLMASEDVEARRHEKLAQRYISLIKRIRYAQFILYGIGLLICFICNLAISHTLSWFFIVLTSELVAASLTLLPILVEKKRGLVTLGGFTLSLLLLLLTCCLFTGGNWFMVTAVSVLLGLSVLFLPYVLKNIWLPEPLVKHKTLLYYCINTVLLFLLLLVCDLFTGQGLFLRAMFPTAAFCLVLPWGMMLIIRYTKINRFFKTAGCLGLSGAFYYLINGVVDIIFGSKPYRFGFNFDLRAWNQLSLDDRIITISSFSLVGLALLFLIAGIVYDLLKAGKNDVAEGRK